jgi:hypothetical protein
VYVRVYVIVYVRVECVYNHLHPSVPLFVYVYAIYTWEEEGRVGGYIGEGSRGVEGYIDRGLVVIIILLLCYYYVIILLLLCYY